MTVDNVSSNRRIVSGMRTTGEIHFGNYHGALKNWVELQHKYESFFFAADWHGLTTNYADNINSSEYSWQMIKNWLSAGLSPDKSTIFIQSAVIEHAELHLLLSMLTPLSWLERVPTYKDQQEKLREKDLATYGFLGYPLLQSADVLVYKATDVPVGEDQVAHIELIREVAKRFNYLYGRGANFIEEAEKTIKKMGKKQAKIFLGAMKSYQQSGDSQALEQGLMILQSQANLSTGDQERLHGYLHGTGKTILPEPEALLTKTSKYPGLDGQKMSKSYGNTLKLTEDPEIIAKKIKTMPTDPARIKRTDPGTPSKCPVWNFHEVYSTDDVKQWVQQGCTTASIGCIECKSHIIDAMLAEQKPILERAAEYQNNHALVKKIIAEGNDKAREVARSTLSDVREAMGISYT